MLNLTEQLLELEHQGWQSLCEGTGADVYGALLAPGAVMVTAQGHVLTREHAAQALAAAPAWDAFDIDDEHLVPMDGRCAGLVYTVRAEREGAELTARVSSVYAQVEGRWRLMLHHLSAVADRAGGED